jgi:hypothetical protein
MDTVRFEPAPIVVSGIHAMRRTCIADISGSSVKGLVNRLSAFQIELGDSPLVGYVRKRRSGESWGEARLSHAVYVGPKGGLKATGL